MIFTLSHNSKGEDITLIKESLKRSSLHLIKKLSKLMKTSYLEEADKNTIVIMLGNARNNRNFTSEHVLKKYMKHLVVFAGSTLNQKINGIKAI